MKTPITIVGAGQLGGLLSYTMLKKGLSVRVIDSGSKYLRKNRQIPWGWLRKFSLQSELKKSIMVDEFPIPKVNLDQNHGPMLITSKNDKSLCEWYNWIEQNPETNSRVFKPKEASNLFNINEEYFQGKGGIYMCDTRDYLINFAKMNEHIWDYLVSHDNCELIEDCHVEDIKRDNITATHLITSKGEIEVNKLVISVGNQSTGLVADGVAKLNITLPYTFIDSISKQKFASIWNKDSSLSFFGNGDIKLACGTQSIFDYKQLNVSNALHFSKMGLSGLSNLNLGKTNEQLIKSAEEELKLIGITDELKYNTVESCNIDLTPNLCPYIYFLPNATNTLHITGFSGSGSMIIDPNFMNLLIDTVENQKLNTKLSQFQPSKNFLKNIFTPENKKTPLSSIV